MVGVEQVLLINTIVSSIILLVLIFMSRRKVVKKTKRYLSKDLVKIKSQISEEDN